MSNNGSKWCRPSRRFAVYARDGFACVYCGAAEGRLTLDHVHPVELGGTHHESNLVTACLSCNSSKRHWTLRTWLAHLRAKGTDTESLARRVKRACARRIDRNEGRRLAALRRAA